MGRDQRPDREGYLDFKLALENGDEVLKNRAASEYSRDKDSGQRTALAWYYDLWLAEEQQVPDALSDQRRESIIRDAKERLALINDPAVREETAARIKDRIEEWDGERFLSCGFYRETCEERIRDRIGQRQARDPDEREAESWFVAKFEIERGWVTYLADLEGDLNAGITHALEEARERDAKALAEREAQTGEKSYFADGSSIVDAFNQEVEGREAQEGPERDGGVEF